jgi:hypothetical protein
MRRRDILNQSRIAATRDVFLKKRSTAFSPCREAVLRNN